MNIDQISLPARTKYVGSQTFYANAGQSLKIETSPDGEDILDQTVPEGKRWEVQLWVSIIETAI